MPAVNRRRGFAAAEIASINLSAGLPAIIMKLFGKNSISERLRVNPASIRRLLFSGAQAGDPLVAEAKKQHITCELTSDTVLEKLAGHHYSQGIIAEVEEFLFTPLAAVLEQPAGKRYTLLALSHITDPQNVGSLLRSAACLGRFAIILPQHRAVTVNETVLKIASGAENYVPVASVTNLVPALEQAKKAGYWIAGAVAEGGEDITRVSLPEPLCLVIGSEGSGIRPGIFSHLDLRVRIPMPGAALSLNAAVAGALLCYEVMRRHIQP